MADSSTESWPGKPLWDSGIRAPSGSPGGGCDFPGLGLHSFRRANITWRQEVGGSAIEASKIAGHSDLETTSSYTFVAPERQNELTRRIQQKLAEAEKKGLDSTPAATHLAPADNDALPKFKDMKHETVVVQ